MIFILPIMILQFSKSIYNITLKSVVVKCDLVYCASYHQIHNYIWQIYDSFSSLTLQLRTKIIYKAFFPPC